MKIAIDWGDVATWVTGLVTFGLFVIGFVQINNERKLRKKNEKELEFRHNREQAEKISGWIVKETPSLTAWVAIINQSPQPIYELIVTIVRLGSSGVPSGIPGREDRKQIDVAPPGKGYVEVGAHYQGMFHRPGVEIAFRDVAGKNWVRESDGKLMEIEKSTLEYYNIELPTGWVSLKTEIPENCPVIGGFL
jgi:hypothetical protein